MSVRAPFGADADILHTGGTWAPLTDDLGAAHLRSAIRSQELGMSAFHATATSQQLGCDQALGTDVRVLSEG